MASFSSASTPRLRIETSAIEESLSASRFGSNRISQDADDSYLRADDARVRLSPTSPTSGSSRLKRAPVRLQVGSDGVQRLLLDTLSEISRRPKAPTVFQGLGDKPNDATGGGSAAFSMLNAIPRNVSRQASASSAVTEDATVDSGEFSTEHAFDLVARLNHILETEARVGVSGPTSIPAQDRSGGNKLRRTSFQGRQQPAQASQQATGGSSGATVFDQLLSALVDLIQDDSYFQINAFRPSRPPNSLQASLLRLAQYLVHKYGDSSSNLTQIGMAMLPAFYSFPPSIHDRLMLFFNSILERIIEHLRRENSDSDVELNKPDAVQDLNDESRASIAINVFFSEDEEQSFTSNLPASSKPNILSLSNPGRESSTYFATALVPALLATVLERLDLPSMPIGPSNPVLQFFEHMMKIKPTIYSDLLAVAAYRQGSPRRTAASLLMLFWPRATGHVCESNELSTFGIRQTLVRGQKESDVHSFCVWRFAPISSHARPFVSSSSSTCRVCSSHIDDYGLFCTSCMSSVHFECYTYEHGHYASEAVDVTNPNVQKIVWYCFAELNHMSFSHEHPSVELEIATHNFRMINLFTLTPCLVCHEPVWDSPGEASKCTRCHQCAHTTCLRPSSTYPACTPDLPVVTVPWAKVRQSFVRRYAELILTPANVASRSFEEVTIVHLVFWHQLQALNRGVETGTLLLGDGGGDREKFELHHTLAQCEAYANPDMADWSPALDYYLVEHPDQTASHLLWYNWSFLTHVVSSLKLHIEHLPSQGLLSAQDAMEDDDEDRPLQSYDIVRLGHANLVLARELNLRSGAIAAAALSHLHILGFFDVMGEPRPQTFGAGSDRNLQLVFPLPFSVDNTQDVETLFATVEGCLQEVDLSLNEFALLLITRKAWPSGRSSPLALERLSSAMVYWILAEDRALATLLVNQFSKLSGLRPAHLLKTWPISKGYSAQGGVGATGGEYVACRRAMMQRYVVPWMLAVYEMNTRDYAGLLFMICTKRADEAHAEANVEEGRASPAEHARNSTVLEAIVKICSTSIIFDAYNDLIISWLHSLGPFATVAPFPLLQKLFSKEDAVRRSSTMALLSGQASSMAMFDPWGPFSASGIEKYGLKTYIEWIGIISLSGVQCTMEICESVSSWIERQGVDLAHRAIFADVVLRLASAHTSNDRRTQDLILQLHNRMITQEDDSEKTVYLLRVTLSTVLLLVGVSREQIISSGLLNSKAFGAQPRRQARDVVRSIGGAKPLLISKLKEYIEQGRKGEQVIILRFFELYICQSSELFWLDQWIASNLVTLTHCAWDLYGMDDPTLSALHRRVLCRILYVDATAFRDLLGTAFTETTPWSIQLDALARLSRISLDLIDPDLDDDTKRWRQRATDIFIHLFSAIWSPQEDVRIAADGVKAALLPTHLDAISDFWNGALPESTVAERLSIVSFLLQLHPHLPRWQMISWECLQVLLGDSGFQPLYTTGPQEVHAITIETKLHSATLLLGLQMLTCGHPIQQATVEALKHELGRFVGFRDLASARYRQLDFIPEVALPCVDELPTIVDSRYSISTAEEGTATPIGAVFIDIVMAIVIETDDLLTIPLSSLHSLLSALLIALMKHELDHKMFEHLYNDLRLALRRTSTLLMKTQSNDVQQLVLALWHTSIQRWGMLMSSSLLEHYVNALLDAIQVALVLNDEILVKQLVSVITTILWRHPVAAVLRALLRRLVDDNGKRVIKAIVVSHGTEGDTSLLRNTILHESLNKALNANDPQLPVTLAALQWYMGTFNQGGYPTNLLRVVASQCVGVASRAAATSLALDVDPLLSMICELERYPALSQDMWSSMDAILRVALVNVPVSSASLQAIGEVVKRQARSGEHAIDASRTSFVAMLSTTLADGLVGRKPLPAGNIQSLISMATSLEENMLSDGPQAVANGLMYLHISSTLQYTCRPSVDQLLIVATWVFRWADVYPQVLSECLLNVLQNDIKAWNTLLLAALGREARLLDAKLMIAHYMDFTVAYALILQSHTPKLKISASTLKHCYIALKTWLLLIDHLRETCHPEDVDEYDSLQMKIWTQLWPPLDRTSTFIVTYNDGSPLERSLLLVIKPSRADLLAFVHRSYGSLLDVAAQLDAVEHPSHKDVSDVSDTIALHESVARILVQFINQDKTEAAESRMGQQGIV